MSDTTRNVLEAVAAEFAVTRSLASVDADRAPGGSIDGRLAVRGAGALQVLREEGCGRLVGGGNNPEEEVAAARRRAAVGTKATEVPDVPTCFRISAL
jgi:hypothetical protein